MKALLILRNAAATSALLAAMAAAVVIATPAATSAQTVAIRGGTVHTGAGDVIRNGTVLIENGVITAVGANVAVPIGIQVIDASGRVVTTGLIDSSTGLGVMEIGAESNTVDASTSLPYLTAAFSIAHAINPRNTLIPTARVEGITRAVVVPGNGAGIFAGTGAIIDLDGGRLENMIVKNHNAMYAVFGEQGAGLAGGSRAAALTLLVSALEGAREFAEDPEAYFRLRSAAEQMSSADLRALAPVAAGEMPLVVTVHRASDILDMLRLQEHGVDLILSGVLEGWMVAKDIADAGVPVIINPMTNLPTFQSLGASYENAARLHEAGVEVVIASFDAHNVRNIKQAAGMAVSYGMPHEAALRSITAAPAELWGLENTGTLAVGNVGDVVVWSGDPLELTTYVEHVFIDGVAVSLETRQRALFRKYRSLDNLPPHLDRER